MMQLGIASRRWGHNRASKIPSCIAPSRRRNGRDDGFIVSVAVALLFSTLPTLAQDRPKQPLSGSLFQSAETRAVQNDDTRNPGFLWVEQGAKQWALPVGPENKSCASCHGEDAVASMKGVAARYPKVDAQQRVINLEGQINDCRERRQSVAPLAYETQELLSLTAYVAFQSRGMPRNIVVPSEQSAPLKRGDTRVTPLQSAFERGRVLFHTRQGQFNLSCSQCHDDLVGKKLRGDTISQGQTHAWPGYRLEWQTMGSLQRRLRACSLGVRAEVLDYGHPDYLALELYLAWRGEGLPMESPGVRR